MRGNIMNVDFLTPMEKASFRGYSFAYSMYNSYIIHKVMLELDEEEDSGIKDLVHFALANTKAEA
tara:strand:+ start:476 stop:670 length:195 start_codon:yes stop_codon:yes gene_type:complete